MSEKSILFRILEDRSFIIALVVIAPFIILTFVIIIYLRDIEFFKDVSAVYAGWVGSVIGYFFGSRQVDKLIEKIDGLVKISEQKVKELDEERRKVANERLVIEKSKTKMYEFIYQYEKELRNAMDVIEMLKRKYVE